MFNKTSLVVSEVASPLESLIQKLMDYMLDIDMWIGYLFVLLKIIMIIIVSRIVISISKRVLQRAMSIKPRKRVRTDPRRARTLGKLITNIITHTINFVTILLVLDQLGIPLSPFIASAGVVGLAVAFAAQNLVRDMITGFFIIFEDQFAVGDVIQTGSIKGEVTEIGIRTTTIRSWTGEVHTVPNGSINLVTNYSIHNSLAVVDFAVTNDIDIDIAISIIQDTLEHLFTTNENIVKKPTILGVQSVAGTTATLRITAECLANTHETVARQLNENVMKALDAKRAEMPG